MITLTLYLNERLVNKNGFSAKTCLIYDYTDSGRRKIGLRQSKKLSQMKGLHFGAKKKYKQKGQSAKGFSNEKVWTKGE